ncbi:hypothetical protein SALBM311S_04500 [Streptomyces alboniger]
MPNRVNAEANAPSRKYLTAASCDISRLRRASAHSRYSGSEKTSSATNSVSRSLAAGKISMPAIANNSSGNTSVVVNPAFTAALNSAAGHRGRLCGEGVDAVAVRLGVEPPFGEGEQADHARQQDRALQEQGRAVDGDRAHRHDAGLRRGVPVGGERDDRGEGAASATTETNSWA